ncbi:hypothetical protein L1987_25416 [Smallanthus sonchifolius]|uniref:Uncharacterized protein n=1 Tax=Smallanthus sonchifolius TaxID=185202 RepID=A0ACB9IP43_9ASTR|nr:hypothetical protein L1987_25416 [Smallanthus sonchifolius]
MNSKQPINCLSSSSHIHYHFYVLVIFLTFTAISAGNETDYQALLKIKSMITQDPYRALTSWNNSLHFCDWTGVTCGRWHKRVTYIVLESRGLEGSLSPHVGNLSFLRKLSLSNNSFQGVIPDELGRLYRLRLLTLEENKFTGVIPANISGCSNLEELNLSKNKLVGSISKAIGFLSKLRVVSLQDNKLTGGIPPFLGNITSMEVFSISRNPLGESIPDTIGHWKVLKEFHSDGCNLYGTIPHSLYNLSLLTRFSSYENQLIGSLPSAIGAMLPHLVNLQLWGNQLTGPFPSSITNCSRLTYLEMDQNKFSGKLKIDFAKLKDISYITLGHNDFGSEEADEMKFIDSLMNCTKLNTLDLQNSKFQGVLPRSIGNLSNQLNHLSLEENQLHGTLPRSIGNLVGLTKLSLGTNKFIGSIPSTIGNLQKLQGNIPTSLSSCTSLSSLSLKGNLFQGMIPSSLSSLKGLRTLDISHNNLSGQIPQFLVQLSLEYLNLSYNDFEGEVSTLGVFANASTISVLGNNRLCGGIVELGLPNCKERTKHKKDVPMFIIVILIASTLCTIICLAYACCKKKNKSKSSQSSTIKRFMKVSYNQLLKATDGFSESQLIGIGGFSSVYKGILDEYKDRFVAIKVLHLQNQGAQTSFMRECEAWRNIRHRNLLKIITSCSSVDFQGNDFKALVYEFMPNGSLHDWLHSSERTSRLNLLQITNILVDVASALDYIHNHCIPTIIHGDLKPSNILLDDDMVAHVGDFGLTRFLGTSSYQNSSTGIKGTIGYVPPEYGLGSEMTSSGDVYSFGILLLEVMTRKRPTDDIFNDGLSLHKFSSMALLDHVIDVIDVNILNVYQEDENFMQNTEANSKKINECLASIVNIGVSCSVDSPSQRMDIKKVVQELHHILDALQSI